MTGCTVSLAGTRSIYFDDFVLLMITVKQLTGESTFAPTGARYPLTDI